MATATTVNIGAELLSVAELQQALPRKVSPGTLRRWITAGVAGHRLEGVRLGGRLFVPRAALSRFLAILTADIAGEVGA
jgi:hypothetical protein